MQNIDIRTAQNVSINYELASLRERILAFVIDIVIVGMGYLIFCMLIFSAFDFDSNMFWGVMLGVGPLAAFMLYQLSSEIFANGQSWGKKALSIRVVRLDGQEPSLSDYLLRAVFYLLDAFLSLGAIGAIFVTSSAKNQRLGDMSANTTVIRTKSSMQISLENILSIDSIEEYEPVYTQVRQLKESDMLFVKEALERVRKHPNAAHQTAIQELSDRLRQILDIQEQPTDKVEFLKTLIRDYIVLTR